MSTDAPTTYVTREDYLARERASVDVRHEWIDGEVREMVGASYQHGVVISNLSFALTSSLRSSGFVVLTQDTKVRVPDSAYYYPDVVVVPHPPEFEDDRTDIVLNPTVAFEVLSPSTRSTDRGEKLDNYRRIDSLTDYLIIDQDRPSIDHWSKGDEGGWRLTIVDDLDADLTLSSLDCRLALLDVYDRVFDET